MRRAFCYFVLLLLSGILVGCGQKPDEEAVTEQKMKLLFIHNNPCEACDEEGRFREILDQVIQEENIEISCRVQTYYAYREDGRKQAEQAMEYFELEQSEILYPILIVGDDCLLGYDQIRQELGRAGISCCDHFLVGSGR